MNMYTCIIQFYYYKMATHPSLQERSFLCSIVIPYYKFPFPEAHSISHCQRQNI